MGREKEEKYWKGIGGLTIIVVRTTNKNRGEMKNECVSV